MMGLSHTVSSCDEIALLAIINLSEGDLNFHTTSLNCMPFFHALSSKRDFSSVQPHGMTSLHAI